MGGHCSTSASKDAMVDLNATLVLLSATESQVGQVSQAMKTMHRVNELMWNTLDAQGRCVTVQSDPERLKLVDDVLEDFYLCNKETLTVLDSITSYKAGVRDSLAHSKAAGQSMITDATKPQKIKTCISPAKQALEAVFEHILPNMRTEISRSLQSYEALERKIKGIVTQLGSTQKKVPWEKGGILVQIGAVAASSLIVTVAACGMPVLGGIAGIAARVVAAAIQSAYDEWGELTARSARVQATTDLLKRFGEEEVEAMRSEVFFTKSAMEDLGTVTGQVETRIGMADTITNFSTTDRDGLKRTGLALIKFCDKMDKKYQALEEQIEFLRTQVINAQRSRLNQTSLKDR
ncbi:hypothetical protein CY35_13G100900 [Sphagnum magellanicum]|nr:hypothetical protein CY35_13G100900 [Sphagnum magellanicum]